MRYAAILFAALALAGCSVYEDEAGRAYTRDTLGIRTAFTTGDLRVITEREHPVTGKTVVCTEPSPDVAKAVSASFFSNIQYNGGTGQPGGNGSLSGDTAEALVELAGRSTALLGLRDGLYRACEAYANGAIGADMYAMVVSRYGQLMTTLFLGQDIASATSAAAKGTNSPPVNIPGSSTTPNSNGGAANNGGANNPPALTPSTATGATPPTSSPATGAAGALARMNEDYLNLDYNAVHTLMVACVNDSDPTIDMPKDPNFGQSPYSSPTAVPVALAPTAPPPPGAEPINRQPQYRQSNPWLKPVCNELTQILGPQGLKDLATIEVNLVKNHVIGTPVDPMIATPASAPTKTPASPSKPSPTGKCVPITNAQFGPLQTALETDGELTKGNMTDMNNLVGAISEYEKKHPATPLTSTCNVGQISQSTLNTLVPPPKKATPPK